MRWVLEEELKEIKNGEGEDGMDGVLRMGRGGDGN